MAPMLVAWHANDGEGGGGGMKWTSTLIRGWKEQEKLTGTDQAGRTWGLCELELIVYFWTTTSTAEGILERGANVVP